MGQVRSYAADKADYIRTHQARTDFRFDPERDGDLVASLDAFGMKENPRLRRYWSQRYRLFTLFDQGCLMDREGWFSVTAERVAQHIAERCRKASVIVDAFCGVGGNAIQFAQFADLVIAIDLDPVKILCARRNAEIYGVADRIQFLCGDFFTFAPMLRADAVFLSPPWGGPEYTSASVFDLDSMLIPPGFKTFRAARAISPNVVFFLPKNVAVAQLTSLAGPGAKDPGKGSGGRNGRKEEEEMAMSPRSGRLGEKAGKVKEENHATPKEVKEVDHAAFRTAGLRAHNELRKRHGVGVLVQNAKLNVVAQRWAESMAAKDKLEHSPQNDKWRLGENIYWSRSFRGNEEEAKGAVDSWYDEINDYSFANPGNSRTPGKTIGHFTEVVWRRCSELGMGIAVSKKGEVYVCANYDPPGNCEDGYEDNVFPVGSTPAPKPLPEAVPTLVCIRHNQLRKKHDSPLLCVNTALNISAAALATAMAKSQEFRYPTGYRFGLNIGLISEFNPVAAVDGWYREGEKFTAASPLTPDISHFAQVVWRDAKRIGVGLAVGRPWSCLVVIYDPKPRNNPKTFHDNVKPPIDVPSV